MCTSTTAPDWNESSLLASDYEDSMSNEIDNHHNTNINCSDSFANHTDSQHFLFYTPELSSIYSTVRWAFFLHAYGFACLFFFLAFYAFFSILNLRSQLSTRPYMSTINSFLCLLGVSRAAGLFIDPYGLKKTVPLLLGSLLWDLGFPCLISSFSLIQIAFLQLTQQLEVGPEKLRKKTCLSVVITIHFLVVIGSAIYSNVNTDLIVVKLAFQFGFSLWGLLLCGSFLYAGKRVLGVLGYPTQDGPSATTINEKGVAGLMMSSLMAPGQNLASSLTAALAPTLLQSSTPKIKITDENDRTVSVASDSSRLNDSVEGPSGSNPRSSTPTPGTSSSNKISGQNGPSSQTNIYVRPPSPVFPRKKSGGSAHSLRNGSSSSSNPSSRRLSFRRDSSSNENELFPSHKKSLTWCENETGVPEKKKHDKDIGEIGIGAATLNVSASDKRRGSRKSMDNNSNDTNTERNGSESLLTMTGGPDFTLQSILSHIAYVNQTALDYRLSRKLSRKNQVHKVIKYTSITAILGVLLCIGEFIRIISPYGFLASSEWPSPWPWFALQTFCRATEFAMGATIANITKQPVNRPPHHYAYSFRHKHQRDSLYL